MTVLRQTEKCMLTIDKGDHHNFCAYVSLEDF